MINTFSHLICDTFRNFSVKLDKLIDRLAFILELKLCRYYTDLMYYIPKIAIEGSTYLCTYKWILKNSWFDDFKFNVEIYTYVWFGPRLAITIIELKKNKRLQFKKTNFVREIETKRRQKLIIDTNILFLYPSFIHHLCSIGYRIMTFLQYYLNVWWKIYSYYNIQLRIILNG